MKRIQLFHEALDRGLHAVGYWGRKQDKPIISHISSALPGPLVLAKRNAGSGYEIVLMQFLPGRYPSTIITIYN